VDEIGLDKKNGEWSEQLSTGSRGTSCPLPTHLYSTSCLLGCVKIRTDCRAVQLLASPVARPTAECRVMFSTPRGPYRTTTCRVVTIYLFSPLQFAHSLLVSRHRVIVLFVWLWLLNDADLL
jgi:hypothetical protein